MKRGAIVASLVFGWALSVRAQPAPPAPTPPATAPPPAAAPPPAPIAPAPPTPPREPEAAPEDRSDARFQDANFDRTILVPNADTHPEGTVTLSSYDIIGLQAGYAFSDSGQVTLTLTPPLEGGVFPADLTLKFVVDRGRRYRIAVGAAATGLAGSDLGAVFLGRALGVATMCFDDPCATNVNFAATGIMAGPVVLAAHGVGLTWRFASFASLLVEATHLMPLGGEVSEYGGTSLGLGVRFSGSRIGVDLAIEKPIGVQTTIPLLVFTYRFLG